jgi:hypothetical protein
MQPRRVAPAALTDLPLDVLSHALAHLRGAITRTGAAAPRFEGLFVIAACRALWRAALADCPLAWRRTSVTAVGASVQRLECAWALCAAGRGPAWLAQWNTQTACRLAAWAQLPVLLHTTVAQPRHGRSALRYRSPSVTASAALRGRIDVLGFLRRAPPAMAAHGTAEGALGLPCEWDESCAVIAAAHSNVALMGWLAANGYPFRRRGYAEVALDAVATGLARGDQARALLSMLSRECGPPTSWCSRQMCILAAAMGKDCLLRQARQLGCAWDGLVHVAAACRGQQHVVAWAHEQAGLPWAGPHDVFVPGDAFPSGPIWKPVGWAVTAGAASAGDSSLVDFAVQRHCGVSPLAAYAAAARGRFECFVHVAAVLASAQNGIRALQPQDYQRCFYIASRRGYPQGAGASTPAWARRDCPVHDVVATWRAAEAALPSLGSYKAIVAFIVGTVWRGDVPLGAPAGMFEPSAHQRTDDEGAQVLRELAFHLPAAFGDDLRFGAEAGAEAGPDARAQA